MSQEENKKQKTSSLDRFRLFYEHTEDSRVVVDKLMRRVKKHGQHIASRF